MSDAIHLSSRSDLVAVVPHLLGFAPQDSLVCVPSQSGGPTARVDLPEYDVDLDQIVEALCDAYRRHREICPSLSVLAFTDDGPHATHAAEALLARLTRTQAIDAVLWVDGDTWTDLRTGETGHADQATRDRISAEFVVRGRALPKSAREELARDLRGDGSELAKLLPAHHTRVHALSPDDLADEGGWLLHSIQSFATDEVPPTDVVAARIVAALHQPALRDLVVAQHTRSTAETMSCLWRDLTRRTPALDVAPVAEVLAFSSWLAGNGAQAWTAIDLIQNRRDHGIADLVAQALAVAAPPRIWDQARTSPNHPTPSSEGPSL